MAEVKGEGTRNRKTLYVEGPLDKSRSSIQEGNRGLLFLYIMLKLFSNTKESFLINSA